MSYLANNFVGIAVPECLKAAVQIEDVFIGPFDFVENPRDLVIGSCPTPEIEAQVPFGFGLAITAKHGADS